MTVRRRFIHGKIKREDFAAYHLRLEKSQAQPLDTFPGTRY